MAKGASPEEDDNGDDVHPELLGPLRTFKSNVLRQEAHRRADEGEDEAPPADRQGPLVVSDEDEVVLGKSLVPVAEG